MYIYSLLRFLSLLLLCHLQSLQTWSAFGLLFSLENKCKLLVRHFPLNQHLCKLHVVPVILNTIYCIFINTIVCGLNINHYVYDLYSYESFLWNSS